MGFPSFGPGNVAVFRDNSGTSLLRRIGTKLQKSDDGGATWADLGAAATSSGAPGPQSDLITFQPGNTLQFRDNSGTSIVARVAGKLQKSDDGGLTFGDLGSSVTTGPTAPSPGLLTFPPNRRARFENESGASILERIAGALKISDDGGATFAPISGGAPVVPGAPVFFYDVGDVNHGGAAPTDGSNIASFGDDGSFGSGADLAQATAGAKPFYRAVGVAGKMANSPALQSDGARWMQSPVIAAQALPCKVGIAFRVEDLSASYVLFDGPAAGGRCGAYVTATSGLIHMIGNGDVSTALSVTAGQCNVGVFVYNGASSYLRLNGVQSANINPQPQQLTGFTLNAFFNGSSPAKGYQWLCGVWMDGTSDANIESYFAARFGATPQ